MRLRSSQHPVASTRSLGSALAAMIWLGGCTTQLPESASRADRVQTEDRILFQNNCGSFTDCAGWRVEAWPNGIVRVEGIDGVAQRSVGEIKVDASKWQDAVALLEAFDWRGFQTSNAAPTPASCPSASYQVLVRWERRDAPANEASVEDYCATNAGHLRASELRRALEVLFLGPPPRMPP